MLIGGAAESVLGLVRMKGLHLEKILHLSSSAMCRATVLLASCVRFLCCRSWFEIVEPRKGRAECLVGAAKDMVPWHATQLI
jgi:hypothetical protein